MTVCLQEWAGRISNMTLVHTGGNTNMASRCCSAAGNRVNKDALRGCCSIMLDIGQRSSCNPPLPLPKCSVHTPHTHTTNVSTWLHQDGHVHAVPVPAQRGCSSAGEHVDGGAEREILRQLAFRCDNCVATGRAILPALPSITAGAAHGSRQGAASPT